MSRAQLLVPKANSRPWIAVSVYSLLQLALLVVVAIDPLVRTQVSIPAAVLSLCAGLSLAVISHLEHTKSIRPSFLITSFLLATLLFDVARVRTQWLLQNHVALAATLTASVAVKLTMLVLEAWEKQSVLSSLGYSFSRESTSGLLSRASFWWLNSLLRRGSHTVLEQDQLPCVHERLSSQRVATDIQRTWATGSCSLPSLTACY
jgi:ATP-binding cassette, subfamily C (CFTR/MRP), member 1